MLPLHSTSDMRWKSCETIVWYHITYAWQEDVYWLQNGWFLLLGLLLEGRDDSLLLICLVFKSRYHEVRANGQAWLPRTEENLLDRPSWKSKNSKNVWQQTSFNKQPIVVLESSLCELLSKFWATWHKSCFQGWSFLVFFPSLRLSRKRLRFRPHLCRNEHPLWHRFTWANLRVKKVLSWTGTRGE